MILTTKTYALTPDHQWIECVAVEDPESQNLFHRVRFPTRDYQIDQRWRRICSAKDGMALFIHPTVELKTAEAIFAKAVFTARSSGKKDKAVLPKKEKRPRPGRPSKVQSGEASGSAKISKRPAIS